MRLEKLNKNNKKYIKTLYKESFPLCERKPFLFLQKSKVKTYAIVENNSYIGLFVLAESENTVFVDYFAIDSKKRGKGVGSRALELLKNTYKSKLIFLEAEDPDVECSNLIQRQQRVKFYKKNMFEQSSLKVEIKGLKAVIMSVGGEISFDDYKQAYISAYGKLFTRFINPRERKNFD